MGLEQEIQQAVIEMPVKYQRIIQTTVAGIHALCALADALEPKISLGAVSVAIVGAAYQDKEEAAEADKE